MDFFRQHILTIVTFWPLFGMAVLFFFNKENKTLIRTWSNLVMIVGFIVSLPLWFWFDRANSDQMQFMENVTWIRTLGANYHVGIDGISLLLVLLTTLLGPLAVLSSWQSIESRVKEYYVFMLMLQAGMLGVFVSLDFFLFYVFWEVMLVPMYFLIGVWGGPRKLYAAIKFFLYTLFGSVLLLLGILALYFAYPQIAAQHPEIASQFGTGATFDILAFHAIAPYLTFGFQYWVFLAFFVGFAIKVPMFPFHTWLPDAHVEAPTAGSVILAGVLLKMGTYGFLRFSLPILPDGTKYFVPMMIVLSIIGIVYGALVAMMQPDMKKLVAYSSVSHLGFVVLGICAMNVNGVQGAMYQMLAHGVSTGGLFLIVGMLSDRRHTRLISEFGGLKAVMPRLTAAFMIITLASIGLPGLNGFIGEFLIMLGAFRWDPRYVVGAGLGVILSAVYMLWMFQRVYYGKVTHPENARLPDLLPHEWSSVVPLCVVALLMGVFPNVFLKPTEPAVTRIVDRLQNTRTLRVNNEMQNAKFKIQTVRADATTR
jgi:NADH-quinone oxidoreductase subunit M